MMRRHWQSAATIPSYERPSHIFLVTFFSHLSDHLLHIVSHLDYLDVDKTEADVVDEIIITALFSIAPSPL